MFSLRADSSSDIPRGRELEVMTARTTGSKRREDHYYGEGEGRERKEVKKER